MRILDRYLLREFVAFLALGVLAFVGIFIVVDVFEKVDDFVDGSASALLVARFYLYYTPFVLVQILPVAMLLASLMALGRFARQHELTAMLMAGLSLRRIFASVFLFAFLVAVSAFFIEQGIVPEANYQRDAILQYDIRHKARPDAMRQRNIRYIGVGGRIYLINSYDPQRALMRGVVIQELTDNALARRIDATTGYWKDDHWQLTGVTVREFAGDSLSAESYDQLALEVPETPTDFQKEERDPEEMSFTQLWAYIKRLRLSGGAVTKHLVDLHMKLAFPLTNFITVLIGASLSTRVRKGGMALGFGMSLAISFIYYCAIRAGQALGHGGLLPPWIAAWIANFIFGTAGLVLFARAQRAR